MWSHGSRNRHTVKVTPKSRISMPWRRDRGRQTTLGRGRYNTHVMAIQFDCPYCTATIRVPDNAAGKKGTCPQCHTKIIVPTPQGLPVESPPGPVMAAPTFLPQAAPPSMPFVGMPPPGFAPPPMMMPAPMFYPQPDGPVSDVSSDDDRLAKARAARRRREARKRKMIWSGIALVVVIAGAVGGFLLANKNKPNPLSGDLTATLLADGKLEPSKIFRDEIKIDSDLLDTALKQLEKPVKLVSERMRMHIRGGADGLQVSLTPGQADLIAVPIAQNKNLANWSKREGGKLADRHRKELAQSATEFVQEWIEANARGDKKPDFGRFHDELGLTSLAMGLGSEAVAIINGVEHRCIAEQSGSLYFLLPQGTKRFELQGHEDAKGRAVFTGRFKVRVTEEDSLKKTKKAEEMEDDDKPSESSKDAFGRPAANDPAAAGEMRK